MYLITLRNKISIQRSETNHTTEALELNNSLRGDAKHDTIYLNRMKDSVEARRHQQKQTDKYKVVGVYSYNSMYQPLDVEEDLRNLKFKCSSKSRAEDDFEFHRNFKSGNTVAQMRVEDSACVCFQVKCDCSSLGLTFERAAKLAAQHFNNNSISDLGNGSFRRYTQLQSLDISDNQIHHLGKDAFVGLSQLNYLDMKNNGLKMSNETFEPGVFAPFESLSVLKINNNMKSTFKTPCVYPDEVLSDLRNLTDLYIDGLPQARFGPGFNMIKALSRLVLVGFDEGYCKMGSLLNDTFENLAQLRFLNVSDCFVLVNNSGVRAFDPLRNLEVLDVSYNLKLGFSNLAKLLRPLKASNMICLRMTSIITKYSTSETVTQLFVSSLPRKLEFLAAKDNALETVEVGVADKLSEGLKYIDLGSNRFVFGNYLQDLPKLKSLEHLLVNSFGYISRVPNGYRPHLRRRCCS